MTRVRHISWLLALTGLAFGAAGCPPQEPAPSASSTSSAPAPAIQTIRVRLFQNANQIALADTANPVMNTESMRRELIFPRGASVNISRAPGGWRIGGAVVPGSILTLLPGTGGVLSVDQAAYHGSLRFVPLGDQGEFDVVNDVQIDDYLKGVLASELYRPWHLETYKAQAVVARTYALFHARTEGVNRYWDVYPDVRSQMYLGIAAETDKSRLAAAATAGLVLTYGEGEGKIFETFFSSDCGGITQSAADAFPTSPLIPPLQTQNMDDCGKASPYHNWGPITFDKDELTRRLRLWSSRRTPPRPQATMAPLINIELAALNPLGRPKTFRVTAANGSIYLLRAEELRGAVNTDAPSGPGNTLPSSFCKVAATATSIVFYDGHGLGHGVGMSQWCAEDQATRGKDFEQIVLGAFPKARLARAY